jgi:hypothetical protein
MFFRTILVVWFSLCGLVLAEKEPTDKDKKEVLIIYGNSTHGAGQHRNKEVAHMLKHKLDHSRYAAQFNVVLSYTYPEDTTLVDQADLVIISSDGGTGHALMADKIDAVKNMKDLDARLKENKAGLIVIHWATDCPKNKNLTVTETCKVNNPIMHRWIGAYYSWGEECKSWTEKFPVKDLVVNTDHPIGNGLPATFKMQDEYYWNFFSEGEGSRNVPGEDVVFIHKTLAGKKGEEFREQSPYWANTRSDGGRSVGMTSAHMYHNWANPHFFQTVANSIFWTLHLDVPAEGVDIATPSIDELKSFGEGATIHKGAVFFE